MTQNALIAEHLEEYGSITQAEAYNRYGIMRLASRISDLKKAGYHIRKESGKGKNRYGETVHFAVYTLKKE